MRISDHSLTGTAGSEAKRVQESQKSNTSSAARPPATPGSTEDHVDLSTTMGTLARAVSADQTSRASRIQALAAQVRGGTYRPDAQATSRSMISEALGGAAAGS